MENHHTKDITVQSLRPDKLRYTNHFKKNDLSLNPSFKKSPVLILA